MHTTPMVLGVFLAGCSGRHHAKDVQRGLQGDRVDVGTVQREIHLGMPGVEVIEALGSPNVLTTDEAGQEVWIYDKFATDVVASGSSWTLLGGGGGFGGSGGGFGAGGASGSAGAQTSSQRTMTVIIKFDEAKRVRDFKYHASRF